MAGDVTEEITGREAHDDLQLATFDNQRPETRHAQNKASTSSASLRRVNCNNANYATKEHAHD